MRVPDTRWCSGHVPEIRLWTPAVAPQSYATTFCPEIPAKVSLSGNGLGVRFPSGSAQVNIHAQSTQSASIPGQ